LIAENNEPGGTNFFIALSKEALAEYQILDDDKQNSMNPAWVTFNRMSRGREHNDAVV